MVVEPEEPCNKTTHFQCDTGLCITRDQLCDKIDHCGDGQVSAPAVVSGTSMC